MKQIKKYSDTRLNGCCIYCSGQSETRDHVPSKILIDKPYPDNLPVVPSCLKCNHSFSKDEEYLACLIECTLRGSTKPEKIEREKVKEILHRKPKLKAQLAESMEEHEGQTFFRPDQSRLKNVILKLARGHTTYENSELQLQKPLSINITPIILMSKGEQAEYFEHEEVLFPEVGSRAFQRLFIRDEPNIDNWVSVQENKYMYSVIRNRIGLTIKFLLCNYLACEVIWS